jgi:hypothetical protein
MRTCLKNHLFFLSDAHLLQTDINSNEQEGHLLKNKSRSVKGGQRILYMLSKFFGSDMTL